MGIDELIWSTLNNDFVSQSKSHSLCFGRHQSQSFDVRYSRVFSKPSLRKNQKSLGSTQLVVLLFTVKNPPNSHEQ
jgi:hypothetical protein